MQIIYIMIIVSSLDNELVSYTLAEPTRLVLLANRQVAAAGNEVLVSDCLQYE